MRSSSLRPVAIAIVVSLVCFSVAGAFQPRINKTREVLRLTIDPEVLASVPPEIAVTQVALGSFRGLMVDYLWTRASQLQQEARYHEAVQLAEWITQLQPRFGRVWAFQSWNLAYNIAITSPLPEERWHWVQASVSLLRDRGIPLNPLHFQLHRELSWLFSHKISDDADDSHYYYKDQLAHEWQELLGVPPEQGRAEWLERVASAPVDAEVLVTEFPALESVGEWLEEEEPAGGPGFSRAVLRAVVGSPNSAPPIEVPLEGLSEADRSALANFLRGRILREDYHMDPVLMVDLMNECGVLDWRHPECHSLYWITQGILRRAFGRKSVRLPTAEQAEQDLDLAIARETFLRHVNVGIAVKRMVFSGRVLYLPEDDSFLRMPEPGLLPFYERTVLEPGFDPRGDEAPPVQLEAALLEAMLLAYYYGDHDQALAHKEKLSQRFASSPRAETYALPLADAVVRLHLREVETADELAYQVQSLLVRSLNDGLAVSRLDVAQRCEALASEVLSVGLTGLSAVEATSVESYDALRVEALQGYLMTPARFSSPRKKSRVWSRLSSEFKRALPDEVLLWLRSQAERSGLDPDRTFPAA